MSNDPRPPLTILGIPLDPRDEARIREVAGAAGQAARSVLGAKDAVRGLLETLGRTSSRTGPRSSAAKRAKREARTAEVVSETREPKKPR